MNRLLCGRRPADDLNTRPDNNVTRYDCDIIRVLCAPNGNRAGGGTVVYNPLKYWIY